MTMQGMHWANPRNDEVITFFHRAKTSTLADAPISEVRDASGKAFHASGITITETQLSKADEATYGYMTRLVGHHIWDAADMRDSDIISDDDVANGITKARIDLDNAVCIPEPHELSKNDRAYLEAMASFDGPVFTTQVAAHMHKIPKYAATYRKRLLDAYVIRETERGEIDFTVPFLREHL